VEPGLLVASRRTATVARHPARGHAAPPPPPPPEPAKRRSHAAAPVAVAILLAGLLLGTYSLVLPVLLGGFLLLSALSFLSSRVNPLSIGYYLHTKPSWSATGILFLSGLLLWVSAYMYYLHGIASILPR
jgi:hypothetical protein